MLRVRPMRRALKNVSIEPPPEWADKTMLAFAMPARAKATTSSVVLTVEQTPSTYDKFVMEELTNCARKGLRFQDQTEGECGGRRSTTLRLIATSDYGPLLQSTTFVDLGEIEGGAAREVAVLTATCPLDQAPHLEPTFRQVLESLKVHKTDPQRATEAANALSSR